VNQKGREKIAAFLFSLGVAFQPPRGRSHYFLQMVVDANPIRKTRHLVLFV